jgi:hypothetical protein
VTARYSAVEGEMMVQSLVKPMFVDCAGTRLEREAIKEYVLQSESDSRIERESLLVVSYGSSGSKKGLSEYGEAVANSHQGAHNNGPAIPKPASSKSVQRNKRCDGYPRSSTRVENGRRGGLWLIEAERFKRFESRAPLH